MDIKDTDVGTHSPEFIVPTRDGVQPEMELVEFAGTQLEGVPDQIKEPELLTPDALKTKKPLTPVQESLRRFRRDTRAMISVGVVVFFIVLAIVGPLIYQHIGGTYQSLLHGTIGPDRYHNFGNVELEHASEGPSTQYWLGTDAVGRDILARLMQGVLISMLNAVAVEIIDIILGVTIGVLAGYFGGWIDTLLARFADIMFAFPGLLFVILLASLLRDWADTTLSAIPVLGANGNARLLLVSMGLAITAWPLMARYVRGQTLQLKEQQYIEAARTSGTSNVKIIMRHIVPNLFSIVIVASTLNIVGTIIGEAGLSYLGLGVQSPGSSLGLMISNAKDHVTTGPLELFVPVIALILIVLAFSFIGDGLRDAFDPRSKD